ncbi:MAG: fliM [Pseudoduganella sp.]|jgi:flagellar motor switch/type III secretory pathway protein FliN|nr:fliM [Pseudoduganella sp.]
MEARDYILWRGSELTALRERAAAALRQWQSAWGALPDQALSCAPAVELAAAVRGLPWQATAGGCYSRSAGWDAALARHLFQCQAAPLVPLATRIVAQAQDALLAALLPAAATEADPDLVRAAFRPGSGVALLTVQLEAATLRLLLPAAGRAAAARRAPSGKPVVPLARALHATPVRLQAEVGSVELTLGHLRLLAPGDVIPLAAPLTQPLGLRVVQGALVGHGHLGVSEGRRALAMTKVKQ